MHCISGEKYDQIDIAITHSLYFQDKTKCSRQVGFALLQMECRAAVGTRWDVNQYNFIFVLCCYLLTLDVSWLASSGVYIFQDVRFAQAQSEIVTSMPMERIFKVYMSVWVMVLGLINSWNVLVKYIINQKYFSLTTCASQEYLSQRKSSIRFENTKGTRHI